MATVTPRQIGPYQIVEELGRGGMGVVYRAFDPAIGRPLAIKVLHMPHLGPEALAEMRQRFAREAAAAGRLSHPGIVTLYQFGQDGDSQYLAMELIPGGSLEKLMCEGQPWRSRDAFPVLRQIAEALDYAHARGIVHRDIKPANVLIPPDSRVKVADFGIARIVTDTTIRTGASMGTPSYMSPEQIHGTKVDARADQFSLAVVAFRMLAGAMPFAAATEYAVINRIVNGEPASLADANPGLPRTADTVIRRALAKAPEARFATCAEFVKALEDVVMGSESAETEELTRRSVPLPVAKKRGPGPWLGVAALVVAGVGGVFYFQAKPGAAVVKTERKPGPVTAPVVNPAPTPPVSQSPKIKANPKDGLTYVWIEPGTFMMGCSPGDTECPDAAKPPHQVTITNGFWMGQAPVTQQAYQDVIGTNPSHLKGAGLPVEAVGWNDARDYCKAVDMRLPTEAEWEYAARAGTTGSRYGDIDGIAWYSANSGDKTHEVKQKAPNAWGLYDMLGNVSQWTDGWYGNYPKSGETDPDGPEKGKYHPVRGGSYDGSPRDVSASVRHAAVPGYDRYTFIGFRCVGN
jgi:serine/threonine protein kinase